MRDPENIKRKLADLLRLSADNNAPKGEIDAAVRAATRLMAKYNLTRDDIDLNDRENSTRNVALGRHAAISYGSKMTTWEVILAHFVVSFVGYLDYYLDGPRALKKHNISVLDDEGRQRVGTIIYFFGADDNAEAAVSFYEELRDTIAGLGIIYHGGWYRGAGASYAQGYAQGLFDAHKKAALELKQSNEQTTALMVQDEKNQLTVADRSKLWLKQTHGVELCKASPRRGSTADWGAYAMGHRHGMQHQPEKGQPTRRLA